MSGEAARALALLTELSRRREHLGSVTLMTELSTSASGVENTVPDLLQRIQRKRVADLLICGIPPTGGSKVQSRSGADRLSQLFSPR